MVSKKPELYNDLHPKKSLKNTGFKDLKTAISTMYNRAKYHPHKTLQMNSAMIIFKQWLNKYKKLRKDEDKTLFTKKVDQKTIFDT